MAASSQYRMGYSSPVDRRNSVSDSRQTPRLLSYSGSCERPCLPILNSSELGVSTHVSAVIGEGTKTARGTADRELNLSIANLRFLSDSVIQMSEILITLRLILLKYNVRVRALLAIGFKGRGNAMVSSQLLKSRLPTVLSEMIGK